MIGQELIDSLQKENIRLKALLESAQKEVHEGIQAKADMYLDPVIGGVLKLRAEVKGLRAHEQELLDTLAESRERITELEEFEEELAG